MDQHWVGIEKWRRWRIEITQRTESKKGKRCDVHLFMLSWESLSELYWVNHSFLGLCTKSAHLAMFRNTHFLSSIIIQLYEYRDNESQLYDPKSVAFSRHYPGLFCFMKWTSLPFFVMLENWKKARVFSLGFGLMMIPIKTRTNRFSMG